MIADSWPMPYVSKGWGYELWIDNSELYCGKQLFIHKGKKLSLHYHKLKNETFFVHEGQATVITYNDPNLDENIAKMSWDKFYSQVYYNFINGVKIHILNAGDNLRIPVGTRHTIKADLNVLIYEFSTQHFDSDSYRVLKGD